MKWEYEFRRIKFVLSKKKREKLVRDLTTNNEELQKLFSSSERLAPLRKRRRTPQAFKQIREQACGLYSVLTTGWRCRCPGPAPAHQANLLLEKRIESSDQKTKSCKGSLKGSKVHLKVLIFSHDGVADKAMELATNRDKTSWRECSPTFVSCIPQRDLHNSNSIRFEQHV